MNKGDKLICLPGYDIYLPLSECFYLEQSNKNNGSFYITTSEEKINTFDQSDILAIHSGEIFLIDNPDYIKPYSPQNFNKLNKIINFLESRSHTYYNFNKWCYYDYSFEYIFYTKFFKKHINHLKFIKVLFRLKIIKLTFHGLGKKILYFFCFFPDVIKHLYASYFDYKDSIALLNDEIREKNSLITRYYFKPEEIEAHIKEKKMRYLLQKINISKQTRLLWHWQCLFRH
jgi:hypothetical protein